MTLTLTVALWTCYNGPDAWYLELSEFGLDQALGFGIYDPHDCEWARVPVSGFGFTHPNSHIPHPQSLTLPLPFSHSIPPILAMAYTPGWPNWGSGVLIGGVIKP